MAVYDGPIWPAHQPHHRHEFLPTRGKTHSLQHGRVTTIVKGAILPTWANLDWAGGSAPRPLDDLEHKLACAQGGHHEAPPLIGRVGLVVEPAAERDQLIQVEVGAAL